MLGLSSDVEAARVDPSHVNGSWGMAWVRIVGEKIYFCFIILVFDHR